MQKPGPQEGWLRGDRINFEVPWQNHKSLDGYEVDQWTSSLQLSPLKHLLEQTGCVHAFSPNTREAEAGG